MNIENLLRLLKEKNIKLSINEDNLKISAPKGAIDDALKKQLQENKAAIIHYFQQLPGNKSQSFVMEKAPPAEKYLLSSAQKGIWYQLQLEPNNYAYNMPMAFEIIGNLQFTLLEQAVRLLIQKHAALRTAIVNANGQGWQEIHSVAAMSIERIDMRMLNENEQYPVFLQHAETEARKIFDLSKPPLLRINLYQLADNKYYLLLVMHHIISDGWSLTILLNDLAYFYNTLLTKEQPMPATLAFEYADYCYSEQQAITSAHFQTQLAFWKNQLADHIELLNMPVDKPRPAMQSYVGDVKYFQLEVELTAKIKQFTGEQNITLFTFILSAYYIMLHKYSGQDTLLVGTNIANRSAAMALEQIIGYFVNTLVLKAEFSDEMSCLDLLGQVQDYMLLAYKNQDIPFDKLVETLSPDRSLTHTPIIQAMCIMQNAGEIALKLTDLKVKNIGINLQGIKYDISLSIQEEGNCIVGGIEYNTDIFNSATITRFTQQLKQLLVCILERPEQKIAGISLLDAQARKLVLETWNATAVDFDQQVNVYDLFAQQVKQSPDAVALVCGGKTMTYAQLDSKANQLANYLIGEGAKANMLIAIYFSRSIEMMVAILAIGKAGAAYLPLDPGYPSERLAYMLTDANVQFVIGPTELLDDLPITQAIAIDFNAEGPQPFADCSVGQPVVAINPGDLAYVIYTSGSTGKPKGVMLTHRGLTNHMRWMQSTFSVTSQDNILMRTSVSFDASVWEVFLPLISGATGYIADDNAVQNAQELVKLIDDAKITIVQFVPLLLAALLDIPQIKACANLRLVFCGGGVLSQKIHHKLTQNLTAALYNLYGPTEATIDSCYFGASAADQGQPIPIGKPINNTHCYVLDRHKQPVPINMPGELYISGYGLAAGYCNLPGLSEEKFINNPFHVKPGYQKMYKTGDLVRWLETGNLEYLGRLDDQVKIRGYRIELGEIEAKLSAYKDIDQAVVAVITADNQSQKLVAYVTTKTNDAIDEKAVLTFLRKSLPCYMLPSAIIAINQMPVLPNGKINKKQLQNLAEQSTQSEDQYVAPQTDDEIAIAKVWSEVLGMEKIGINDNFFGIGGDSILSIQIVAKCNLQGIYITPKQMMQNQTIAKLVVVARDSLEAKQEGELALNSNFCLTPIQRRFFAHHGMQPQWNQAILLTLREHFPVEAIKQAMQKLLCQHDSLRMFFHQENGDFTQSYHDNSEHFIFATVALPSENHEETMKNHEIIKKYQQQFNLANGPLFAVVLFTKNNQSHQLLLIAHHLVVDAVSWRILKDDLTSLLKQLRNGTTTLVLAKKTSSYQYWANALLEHAQSPLINKELSFWLAQTHHAKGTTPRDFSGENTVSSLRSVKVILEQKDTYALFHDVLNRYRCQINNVLLTATGMALANWFGNDSLFVDLEGHGREEVTAQLNLTRTVGWFTTIYPCRLQVAGQNIEKSLQLVNDNIRLIPNRGINYSILRYLADDRAVKQQLLNQPQAEICFNYLGQFEQEKNVDNLLTYAEENIEHLLAGEEIREYVLDVTMYVLRGFLNIEISYSQNIHSAETVQTIASSIKNNLLTFIAIHEKNKEIVYNE